MYVNNKSVERVTAGNQRRQKIVVTLWAYSKYPRWKKTVRIVFKYLSRGLPPHHFTILSHRVTRGGTTWTWDFKCGEVKTDFSERDECKPVLLGLSLVGNLVKPLISLYGTEWRDRGYGLWGAMHCRVFALILRIGCVFLEVRGWGKPPRSP
jgi:hypothetical protein